MKIYTKTGDKGETSLYGGKRISKSSLRLEVYGTIDELNSIIGICRSMWPPEELEEMLEEMQEVLFVLGADLATPFDATAKVHRISNEDVEMLEKYIDSIEPQLEPLRSFILPGGSGLASHLHFARTVCRRAERITVMLAEREKIGDTVVVFLNRLSDFIFVLARWANHLEGREEIKWLPQMRTS
ncbi:MAG: cob(I)yrinic acid a,c-diamide adenosyltransferase [Ignavibacteria bacterium]|nr:cob(I)yrinic acid a,c-diamide adenosyltransferase [Ignavibacteria bacterium]